MIKYYKLFDLLNRKGKKKTDLLEIISSKTLAKLSKGENINTEVIDKICIHLHCQPSDIMEVFEVYEKKLENGEIKKLLIPIQSFEEMEKDYYKEEYWKYREKSYEEAKKATEEGE